MSASEPAASWFGIDRVQIDWAPRIDEELCAGCGLCVVGCGRKVFEYDYDRKRAVVARPTNCMVACTTCKTLCPHKAISFPPESYIARLIKEHRLTQVARQRLAEAHESAQGSSK